MERGAQAGRQSMKRGRERNPRAHEHMSVQLRICVSEHTAEQNRQTSPLYFGEHTEGFWCLLLTSLLLNIQSVVPAGADDHLQQ
mgnify:CR=1 FL=1